MTNTIANSLQLAIDRSTELIELTQAGSDWQTKIGRAIDINDNNNAVYIIFPQTTEVLAAIIKQIAPVRERILICGGGSKLGWGNLSRDIKLVISTQKCDRLVEHAVGDLTVTVEAGMKLGELQDKLRSHNQFLPIDPSYPDTATLGGIVATADAGSWRQRYGSVRDLLLGLSFVRADGAIAKAGGRVVKNVAGYDLMKLFTGAYGTLGIISQLTFRTYPLMATSQTLVITGQAGAIDRTCQSIRNSGLVPTAMDLLSQNVVERLGLGKDFGLVVRWQAIPESIAQQIAEVKAIAENLNLPTRDYQDRAEIDLWQKCNALTTLPDSDAAVTGKIGIAPTSAVNFLQLKEITQNNAAVRIHAGSGIGRLQLTNTNSQTMEKMRSHCQKERGFLTILDAPESIKQQLDVWGYTGNAKSTMQNIKNQFDPHNILNPNRFIV